MNSTTTATAIGVFSATDLRGLMAVCEAKKAAERRRELQERDAREKGAYEDFQRAPPRTREQVMAQMMHLVQRAAEDGAAEVQIEQFPSVLCLDSGRAINNFQPNWPDSLTGRAQRTFEFWRDDLKPLGFGMKAQILDYPAGFLGDVGLFLTW